MANRFIEESHCFRGLTTTSSEKISPVMDAAAAINKRTAVAGTSIDAALELEELEAMRSRRLSF